MRGAGAPTSTFVIVPPPAAAKARTSSAVAARGRLLSQATCGRASDLLATERASFRQKKSAGGAPVGYIAKNGQRGQATGA